MNYDVIQPGNFYHIYNRGINSCNLFEEKVEYVKFLQLFNIYIFPVCEVYAYALMKNHFHLLVRIKEDVIYKYSIEEVRKYTSNNQNFNANRSKDAVGLNYKNNYTVGVEYNKWETIARPDSVKDLSASLSIKTPNATKHFSHLFNAYGRYYNVKNNRHGALFERPFKRKLINSEEYLRQSVLYIHNNPVHHGFMSNPAEYAWSSYLTCMSEKETKLHREEVISMFGDKSNFEYCHLNYKICDEKDYFE